MQKYLGEANEQSRQKAEKAAHIKDLERRLAGVLGTKVRIDAKRNGRRGKITIEFYSLDDFDRIMEKMGVASVEEG